MSQIWCAFFPNLIFDQGSFGSILDWLKRPKQWWHAWVIRITCTYVISVLCTFFFPLLFALNQVLKWMILTTYLSGYSLWCSFNKGVGSVGLSQVISALCTHTVDTTRNFVLWFPNGHFSRFWWHNTTIEPCLMFTVSPSASSVCILLFLL